MTTQTLQARVEKGEALREAAIQSDSLKDYNRYTIDTLGDMAMTVLLSDAPEKALEDLDYYLNQVPFIDNSVHMRSIWMSLALKDPKSSDLASLDGMNVDAFHDALQQIYEAAGARLSKEELQKQMNILSHEVMSFAALSTYFIAKHDIDMFDTEHGFQAKGVDSDIAGVLENYTLMKQAGANKKTTKQKDASEQFVL